MKLGLIYARAANGVIGIKGQLPWHLPEDLQFFKQTTLGCPVIMGRKTWDSLPERFRPLPGRLNIVLTQQPGWTAAGAATASTLEQALELARSSNAETAWVIGGAQIYAHALPLADTVVVTEIEAEFEGDAFAPVLEPSQWQTSSRESHTSKTGLGFSFVKFTRKI